MEWSPGNAIGCQNPGTQWSTREGAVIPIALNERVQFPLHHYLGKQEQHAIGNRDDKDAFGRIVTVAVDIECKQGDVGDQAPGTHKSKQAALLPQDLEKLARCIVAKPQKINDDEHEGRQDKAKGQAQLHIIPFQKQSSSLFQVVLSVYNESNQIAPALCLRSCWPGPIHRYRYLRRS